MGSRILSFIGLFILSAFPAWSQTGEWKDEYSRFTDLTPWVRSSNPAGIATLPVGKTSTVRASLEKKNGGLMDLHESRDCFRPSLDAASYMRISDRITFYGRMNYSYFKGKDMGGQILMDPYYNPINFLESVDTTTGTKTLEEYTLEGAMAYSLNDRLTLAGKVSYQSADYAKRKDPRSYNQWMDLDASVGARYSLADGKTAFGVSLNYVKTVETVAEKLFGTIDRQYYCFVDYGGSFGKVEVIDGDNGYLSVSNERPMFNQFFGGSAQAGFKVGGVDAFLDLGAAYRKGYFGKKASGSVRFCDFDGMRYNLNARISFKTGTESGDPVLRKSGGRGQDRRKHQRKVHYRKAGRWLRGHIHPIALDGVGRLWQVLFGSDRHFLSFLQKAEAGTEHRQRGGCQELQDAERFPVTHSRSGLLIRRGQP